VRENPKERLFRQANALLNEPTTEFRIVGLRMLARAQQALARSILGRRTLRMRATCAAGFA
jgi:hypothetical protein